MKWYWIALIAVAGLAVGYMVAHYLPVPGTAAAAGVAAGTTTTATITK